MLNPAGLAVPKPLEGQKIVIWALIAVFVWLQAFSFAASGIFSFENLEIVNISKIQSNWIGEGRAVSVGVSVSSGLSEREVLPRLTVDMPQTEISVVRQLPLWDKVKIKVVELNYQEANIKVARSSPQYSLVVQSPGMNLGRQAQISAKREPQTSLQSPSQRGLVDSDFFAFNITADVSEREIEVFHLGIKSSQFKVLLC